MTTGPLHLPAKQEQGSRLSTSNPFRGRRSRSAVEVQKVLNAECASAAVGHLFLHGPSKPCDAEDQSRMTATFTESKQ